VATIRLFTGDYFFQRGNPIAIVGSQTVDANYTVADVFVIFQEVPSLEYRLNTYQHITLQTGGLTFPDIPNWEQYMLRVARDWVQGHLQGLQLDDYTKSEAKYPGLLRPIELREDEPYQDALRRMRLRGLSDNIIQQLGAAIRDQAFRDFLNQQVRPLQKIVVENRS
jgi:hypothetical protein